MLQQIALLSDALHDEADREHVTSCVNLLDKLVAGHLETEETLMDTLGYPGAAQHKVEHAELAASFQELRDMLRGRGGSPDLATELNLRVNGWLFKHVLKTDRTFSAFLREGKHADADADAGAGAGAGG